MGAAGVRGGTGDPARDGAPRPHATGRVPCLAPHPFPSRPHVGAIAAERQSAARGDADAPIGAAPLMPWGATSPHGISYQLSRFQEVSHVVQV